MRWSVTKIIFRRLLSPMIAAFVVTTLTSATLAQAVEKKTLKIAFRAAETGFDPQRIEDRYSVGICENIFDSLISYDWLARPVKMVPNLAHLLQQENC